MTSGAAVRSALEPLAQPSGAHDERNREQRMADALVERLSGGQPANLQVTATIETLKGLAGAAAGEGGVFFPHLPRPAHREARGRRRPPVLLRPGAVAVHVRAAPP